MLQEGAAKAQKAAVAYKKKMDTAKTTEGKRAERVKAQVDLIKQIEPIRSQTAQARFAGAPSFARIETSGHRISSRSTEFR